MRAAPEAEDVIWENLQCSRWERSFRSLVALFTALVAVTASTAAITYSSVQQTTLMRRFVTGEAGVTFYELLYNYVGFLALLIFGYVSIFALVTRPRPRPPTAPPTAPPQSQPQPQPQPQPHAPSLHPVVPSLILTVPSLQPRVPQVPLLGHKVERYHTFAAREMNICYKLSFFQACARRVHMVHLHLHLHLLTSSPASTHPAWRRPSTRGPGCDRRHPTPPAVVRIQVLNTALPSTICTWVDNYNPLGTWSLGAPWYATGGTVILTALVGDFIFINFLIDFIRPDVLFIRRFLAPRARTQRQMNALYKRDADIYVAFRLQARASSGGSLCTCTCGVRHVHVHVRCVCTPLHPQRVAPSCRS